MLKGIMISAVEIFALIFAFYGVVALGGQDCHAWRDTCW